MFRLMSVSAADFGYQVHFANSPVVVDFYADWCGPCRVLGPVLERFADKYHGAVKFVKVDVDNESELAGHYGVSSIATLLFFRGGELVNRIVGLPSAGLLQAKLDALSRPAPTRR